MMDKKECANTWKKVVKIYNNTIDENNPELTAKEIVRQLGKNKSYEVFATIAKIKEHDGRISPSHRKKLAEIKINPEAVVRTRENPVIYAGLDDIHTAHIDNIITQLLKL